MIINVPTNTTIVEVVKALVDCDELDGGDFPWSVTSHGLTADVEFPNQLLDYMQNVGYDDPDSINGLWPSELEKP
jgi:hypothetical protein